MENDTTVIEQTGAEDANASVDTTGASAENTSSVGTSAMPDAETIVNDVRQQASAPAAGGWNGQEWALKFRGKEIAPKTREELIAWAQQGYNNNLRMRQLQEREAEINAKHAEYEKGVKELEQLRSLAQAFDAEPQFKKAVFDIFTKMRQGNFQGATQTNENQLPDAIQPQVQQYIDSLEKKLEDHGKTISELRSRFEQADQQKADDDVRKEIDELKKVFDRSDWDTPDAETGKSRLREVLEHAAANGMKLKQAYRDLYFDEILADEKARALKEAQNTEAKNGRAALVGTGGSGRPPAPAQKVNVGNATYNQIAEMAVNELRQRKG